MDIKYFEHIKNSIEKAENNISKINDDIIKLNGMTGTMTRHFYNNLLELDDARYLEIGVWAGSSVCSAMYNNKATVFCIDNFSEYTEKQYKLGFVVKDTFLNNFNRYKGENNAYFIENDCFNVDVSILPKFNIYLYDGNHSEDSHYKALTHFYDCLDDIFILLVDDWDMRDVRDGSKRAIERLNLKVLYYFEIRLNKNDNINTHIPNDAARRTWWNGLYIAVIQKNN